ncbi:proline-specific peptidase [Rickenella mellea]|uniref:Proline-specific peptidase n=1 Tax=Rickenella mellea TaxID=50990 RepID=A0A4Y7QK16_9AGAM|nr:proline-specific peptidase [Rickenella mellea]
MTTPQTTEGKADFCVGDETYQTWYKVVGDLKSSQRPLVTLHGGPGAAHYYLLSLADLSSGTSSVPVVFYDQLGISNSTHLPHKGAEFWTPSLFMDELENLLNHLKIADNFDLLGHSWGGMLAAQFAATRRPSGLNHLIISDSPASMALWEEVCSELIKRLPDDVHATLKKHEDEGTTDSKEYQDAMDIFYAKHVCRIQPLPDLVAKSFAAIGEDPTVYHTMNGPSEFHVIGTLKTLSIISELHNINIPTLILNSRYDEAQDACVVPFFNLIPKAKWYTFANSSHMPHWEERERYMQIVGDFLKR